VARRAARSALAGGIGENQSNESVWRTKTAAHAQHEADNRRYLNVGR
jgi:hypothetical protein